MTPYQIAQEVENAARDRRWDDVHRFLARRLVERMRGWDADTVFGMSPGTRDALFRRARDRAGLSGFTFHDARHSAATRMAQKLHILDLCKAFGWSNLNQATGYYNPTAAQIAGRL